MWKLGVCKSSWSVESWKTPAVLLADFCHLLPIGSGNGRFKGVRRGETVPSVGEIPWVFKSVYVQINWRIKNHFISFSKYLGLVYEVAKWLKNYKTKLYCTKNYKHQHGVIMANVTNTYQIHPGHCDCSLLKSLWNIIHPVGHWAWLIY